MKKYLNIKLKTQIYIGGIYMEETYINKFTFKDLILKYLIEEILKEKGDSK